MKKGEYIAVVQNPASTEDVRKIADLINRIDFDGTHLLALKDTFPGQGIFRRNQPSILCLSCALKVLNVTICSRMSTKSKERISRRALNGKKKIVREAEDSQKARKR